METILSIEGTKSTPTIEFNAESGMLSISGKSVPADAVLFFEPIFAFIKQLKDPVILKMKMEYVNTSSSKNFLALFNKLPGGSTVIWYYEEGDEDYQESGEDFKSVVKKEITFELSPYV